VQEKDIRSLAKVLFARGGKREKVKRERENNKPFPDFCKKSIDEKRGVVV